MYLYVYPVHRHVVQDVRVVIVGVRALRGGAEVVFLSRGGVHEGAEAVPEGGHVGDVCLGR